jgi:putative membrane protein
MSNGLETASHVLVLVVAVLHLGFFVLEAILWQRPVGLRVFGNTPERARIQATLALNQGVYNLFLTAALLLGLVFEHIAPAMGTGGVLILFGLSCVLVAGLVGAWTVSWRILLVQGAPAAVALLLFLLSWL